MARNRRTRHHVVPQDVFHHALARERRRADRFEEPFTLMLADLSALDREQRDQAALCLAEAFSTTTCVGWYGSPRTLGVIVTHGAVLASTTLARRELERRLGADARVISIRTHAYPAAALIRTPHDTLIFPEPDRPRTGDVLKRVVDLIGASLLLLLSLPVIVIVAALLKLTSPGPVLFRQERVGEGGRPFVILKFRTMRVDADQALHQEYVTKFLRLGAQLNVASRKVLQKLTNDPRVTPVGRLLRKSSLDELPQLWNVLRGEMSLVGPRPPLPYEVAHYQRWHRRRVLDAKPGLTGLWQVVGRSRTTFDEMVRLDIRYVRRRSFWTDLRILLATPRAIISGKGAG